MPSLMQPYEAKNTALAPTERGTDARLLAGRRTAGFYNEAAEMISGGARAEAQAAGDVAQSAAHGAEALKAFADQQENFAGHREIVAGSAAAAKLNLDLQNKWDDLASKADPNDPTIAAKFRETVLEPALDQFTQAYSNTDRGQQWAEAHAASMRNHFYQKTAADMSFRAGEAVKTNAREVINTNTNAAFKSPDFHTVDYLLGQTESSIAGIVSSSPNVKGVDSAKLHTEITEKAKEQIVKAAAQGAIMKARDPEAVAQQFADRYPTLINGAEAKQLAQAAKVQAKTNFLQNKQIEEYQLRQQERAARAGLSKTFADNVSFDPATNRYTIKPEFFNQTLQTLYKYPSVSDVATRAQLDWGQHQQNQREQPTVSDPQVKADLYTRMFDPTNPTSQIDIMKAEVEKKLSAHDGTAMRGLQKAVQDAGLHGEGFKESLSAAKGVLTYSMPGIPGKDPRGMENYARFVQDFVPKYQAAVRNGTLPPNALDFKDPNSLISKTMEQYKRAPKDILADRMQELSGLNLTGEGKEITGIETVNAPPVPAPKQREIGKVYELPKGKFKWNGVGWEKP